MQLNNWFNKRIIRGPYFLLLIMLIAILYRLFYFGILHPNSLDYGVDSVSYFSPIDLLKGLFDIYRPPVYPTIINLFEHLFHEDFLRKLVLFQQLISLASIIPFYIIGRRILKNDYFVIISSLFYACWTPILLESTCINPEALCIAGSTLLFYLLINYLSKPSKTVALSLGILTLILILLKPTYLIVIALLLVLFIVRFILYNNERKHLIWGLTGCLIALLGVIGYCKMNEINHQLFTFSKISQHNSLCNIILSGAYKQGNDKEFITIIDTSKQKGFYTSVYYLDNEMIDNYAIAIKRFPKNLPPTSIMTFNHNFPNTINYPYKRVDRFITNSQCTSIYFRYLIHRNVQTIKEYKKTISILALLGLLLIYQLIKHKRIAWMHWISALFIGSQFLTITLFVVDSRARLFMPCIPFIILMITSFLGILFSYLNNKNIPDLLE